MKVLALFSGGLDSLIACKLLKDLGYDVIALHFNIGFGSNTDKQDYLHNATAQIGVPLKILDIKEQFFDEVLFAPKYGYGRFFNPCIDCHGNMFAQAFMYLASLNEPGFIISGEVLGQRPKSQRRDALAQVKTLVREIEGDKRFDALLGRGEFSRRGLFARVVEGKIDSTHLGGTGVESEMDSMKNGDLDSTGIEKNPRHLDDLILRPLCAKLMEPTWLERASIIDRERLLGLSGRGRAPQLEMAKSYGFRYYEKPGGGCLLTDLNIAKKLKDLSALRRLELNDTALIKQGRYLALDERTRLIIARNDVENARLDLAYTHMDKITLLDCVGPIGFLSRGADCVLSSLAASITLGYGRAHAGMKYHVRVGDSEYEVEPLAREISRQWLL